MGFAHVYVKAEPDAVERAIEAHLSTKGFRREAMTPDRHPTRMQQIHEGQMRLFWLSPRQNGWTGLFEFRYYSNERRERWGYSDEHLALALSKALGEVFRFEVLDGRGFWLFARYRDGAEVEGKAYEDVYGRSLDLEHPRYELNRIIDREGFLNVGIGYEHIPGPSVAPIDKVPQSAEGIEGYAEFRHLAFVPEPGKAE